MQRHLFRYVLIVLTALALLWSIATPGPVTIAQDDGEGPRPLNAPGTGGLCVRVDRAQLNTLPQPDGHLIIMDTSSSMDSLTRVGPPRINLAKSAVRSHVQALPDDTQVALRDFGAGCGDTQLRVPLGPVDKATLTAVVDSLETFGDTPIAESLFQISSDLAGVQGSKEVLLVTDGQESCGGDPVSVAEGLAQADPNLSIHVIGFDVNDVQAQQNLRQIPQAARGAYIPADTEADLLEAMSVIVQVPFQVYDPAGRIVTEDFANRGTTELMAGQYRVDIPLLEVEGAEIEIGEGRGTALRVGAGGEVTVNANDARCIARFCLDVPLPRLEVGEAGFVSIEYGDPRPVLLRTDPGLQTGENISQMALREHFRVLDGPVCLDGYMWWYVQNSSREGWAAEGVFANYFLDPFDPAEYDVFDWEAGACGNELPWALEQGGLGMVNPAPGGTANDLRAVPNGNVTARLQPGETFRVVDGPQCTPATGTSWWYVRAEDGREGWTPEGALGEYYLLPVYEPSPLELYGCVASATFDVRQRSGPGTNFDQDGALIPGEQEGVTGQTDAADGFVWYLLANETWVRSDLVTVEGPNCADLPEGWEQ